MNELLVIGGASFLVGLGLGLLYHSIHLMRRSKRYVIEGRRHTKRYMQIQKKYDMQKQKLDKVLDKYGIETL